MDICELTRPLLRIFSRSSAFMYDENGLTICPQCKRHYAPDLGKRSKDGRAIQEIYPDAKPYQREQLVSGLCSDECWDRYLGVDRSWRKEGGA